MKRSSIDSTTERWHYNKRHVSMSDIGRIRNFIRKEKLSYENVIRVFGGSDRDVNGVIKELIPGYIDISKLGEFKYIFYNSYPKFSVGQWLIIIFNEEGEFFHIVWDD